MIRTYSAPDGYTAVIIDNQDGCTLTICGGDGFPRKHRTYGTLSGARIALGMYGEFTETRGDGWRVPALHAFEEVCEMLNRLHDDPSPWGVKEVNEDPDHDFIRVLISDFAGHGETFLARDWGDMLTRIRALETLLRATELKRG